MNQQQEQSVERQHRQRKNWLPAVSSSLPMGSRVAVIGAGIAGATVAAELANAGFFVTVFDSANTPAAAASGNLAGNCLPVVDRGNAPYNQWYWQAWRSAYQWWQSQADQAHYGDLSAALKWSANAHKQATWQKWVEELAQPDTAQWHNPLSYAPDIHGVWFKRGGYLVPKRVVAQLLSHVNIQLKTQTAIQSLQSSNSLWRLTFNQGESAHFDGVVVAAGAQTAQLLPEWQPFLQLNKGQVSHIAADDWQQAPSCVLSYGGYATPSVDGVTCIGATFEGDTPLGLTDTAHQHNLAMLTQALPNALHHHSKPIGGHSAYRAMTTDHLPIVGQALDVSAYQTRMRACALHPDTCPQANDLLLPNLWLSVGHGSRGLTSSFLAASLLKAQIAGQACPVVERLQQAVHPARVIFRQLAQNALR